MIFNVKHTLGMLPKSASSNNRLNFKYNQLLSKQVCIKDNELIWTDGMSRIRVPVDAEDAVMNRSGQVIAEASLLSNAYDYNRQNLNNAGATLGLLEKSTLGSFFRGVGTETVQVKFTDEGMILMRQNSTQKLVIPITGSTGRAIHYFEGRPLLRLLKFVSHLQRMDKSTSVIVKNVKDDKVPLVFQQGDAFVELKPIHM